MLGLLIACTGGWKRCKLKPSRAKADSRRRGTAPRRDGRTQPLGSAPLQVHPLPHGGVVYSRDGHVVNLGRLLRESRGRDAVGSFIANANGELQTDCCKIEINYEHFDVTPSLLVILCRFRGFSAIPKVPEQHFVFHLQTCLSCCFQHLPIPMDDHLLTAVHTERLTNSTHRPRTIKSSNPTICLRSNPRNYPKSSSQTRTSRETTNATQVPVQLAKK